MFGTMAFLCVSWRFESPMEYRLAVPQYVFAGVKVNVYGLYWDDGKPMYQAFFRGGDGERGEI